MTFEEINSMSRRQINKFFRQHDDSNLWPICGRFNATETAIRRLRRMERQGLEVCGGYEYFCSLERMIIDIVNDPKL